MKLQEMGIILGKAFLTYPNLTLTKETIAAWYELFFDADAASFQKALQAAIQEPGREFFPTPGIVRKYLQTPCLPAPEAWNKAVALACGAKLEKDPEDSLIFRAAQAVGWDRIRYADLETEIPFIRRDFCRYYQDIADNDRERELRNVVEITHKQAKAFLENNNIKIKGIDLVKQIASKKDLNGHIATTTREEAKT